MSFDRYHDIFHFSGDEHIAPLPYRTPRTPAPSEALILEYVEAGKIHDVGAMLQENRSLACVGGHSFSGSSSHLPPLALYAEYCGHHAIAKAIGIHDATGIWSPSGRWPNTKPVAKKEIPAAAQHVPFISEQKLLIMAATLAAVSETFNRRPHKPRDFSHRRILGENPAPHGPRRVEKHPHPRQYLVAHCGAA